MIYYIKFLGDFEPAWSKNKLYRVRRVTADGNYVIIDNNGCTRFTSDTARGVFNKVGRGYDTNMFELVSIGEETTSKPRFEVGERVKVSTDLRTSGIAYKNHLAADMVDYAGKEATIASVRGKSLCYFIDIDDVQQDWCWTEDMLDKVEEEYALSIKCTKAKSTFWTKGASYEVRLTSDGSYYVRDDDKDGWGGDTLDSLLSAINLSGNEFELLDKRPTEAELEPELESEPESELESETKLESDSESESKHTLTDLGKIEAKITALSEESYQLFTKSEELSNKAVELQDESEALEEALYLIKQYLKEGAK